MSYRPGNIAVVSFVTNDPVAPHAPANATGTPLGTVLRNGIPDLLVPVVVTNTGTGEYFASFTIPLTYLAADTVELGIDALFGTTTYSNVYSFGALESTLSASAGTTDWTELEKTQLRFRLGIDGIAATPLVATPDLARQASVDAANAGIVSQKNLGLRAN